MPHAAAAWAGRRIRWPWSTVPRDRHEGLRIVDASVFAKIPGFFIVTPIYMISEKASEVIAGEGV
jgi:choline dehydrogenase-like flavoprotein